jgi:hypothetical protein
MEDGPSDARVVLRGGAYITHRTVAGSWGHGRYPYESSLFYFGKGVLLRKRGDSYGHGPIPTQAFTPPLCSDSRPILQPPGLLAPSRMAMVWIMGLTPGTCSESALGKYQCAAVLATRLLSLIIVSVLILTTFSNVFRIIR